MKDELFHIKIEMSHKEQLTRLIFINIRNKNDIQIREIQEWDIDAIHLLAAFIIDLLHHGEGPYIGEFIDPPTTLILRTKEKKICEMLFSGMKGDLKTILHIDVAFQEQVPIRVLLVELIEVLHKTMQDIINFLKSELDKKESENRFGSNYCNNMINLYSNRINELRDRWEKYQKGDVNPNIANQDNKSNPAFYSNLEIFIPPVVYWGSRIETPEEIQKGFNNLTIAKLSVNRSFNIVLGQNHPELFDNKKLLTDEESYGKVYFIFNKKRYWYCTSEYYYIINSFVDSVYKLKPNEMMIIKLMFCQMVIRKKNDQDLEIVCGYFFTTDGFIPEKALFSSKNDPQTVSFKDYIDAVINAAEEYFHAVKNVFKWDIGKQPKLLELANKLEELKEKRMTINKNA